MLYQGDGKTRFVLGEVTGDNPLICFGINPSNAKIVDNKLQTDKTIKKIRYIADMEKKYDAISIFDADNLVSSNYLLEMNMHKL